MDYSNLSLAELKNIAKEKGLKGISSLKKQELIDLLGKSETSKEEKKPAAQPEVKKEVKTATEQPMPEEKASQRPSQAEPRSERPAPRYQNYSSDRPQNYSSDRPQNYSSDRPQNYSSDRPQGTYQQRPQGASYRPGSQGTGGQQRPSGPERPRPQGSYQPRPQYQSEERPSRPQYQSEERPSRPQYQSEERPARPQYQSEERPSRPQNPTTPEDRQAQFAGAMEHKDMGNATEGRIVQTKRITTEERMVLDPSLSPDIEQLDSGETKTGILEVMSDGYGFIRCDNFLPGDNDVYVSPAQIRKFNLKTGDIIKGNTKVKSPSEKFSALLYMTSINGFHPNEAASRPRFEDLTPVFPNERLHLETPGCAPAMRIVDLLSPIGKGQRGMIVSQPKAGKTTLLKQIAKAINHNHPEMHLIILLIDERPEEVTDMKESISGPNVEVIYSTFDELPDNHKRVSEMVIERAKRLVEHKKDVVILLDSITRLARAYNLTCVTSGRTLSGGLDPAALYMPKKFFGAARNMREGGSLTVLATALVDTGSRMDDVVFEEFKGTGNMELVLDRNLSEKRIFPAIDLPKSGTRREDLLLTPSEMEANFIIRRAFNSSKSDEAVERIINLFASTKTNAEFIDIVRKTKLAPQPRPTTI